MSDSTSRSEQVSLRRAPKYGSFIGIGAFLGVIAAVVIYLVTPIDTEFGAGATIGFIAMLTGGLGIATGAVVALIFDRSLAKKAQIAQAERATQDDE